MKKIAAMTLVLLLVLGLCACRMGSDTETTPETENTTPPAVTDPIVEPTVMDPTMETNIPDPNVDNDHLVDPTGDGTGNGTGNGTGDDAARSITRRINGLS